MRVFLLWFFLNFSSHPTNRSYSVANLAPDGSYVVGAQCDGAVQLWDLRGSLLRPESVAQDMVPDVVSIAWDSEAHLIAMRSLRYRWAFR